MVGPFSDATFKFINLKQISVVSKTEKKKGKKNKNKNKKKTKKKRKEKQNTHKIIWWGPCKQYFKDWSAAATLLTLKSTTNSRAG